MALPTLEAKDRWNRFKLEFESYLKNNKDWFGLSCSDLYLTAEINGVKMHVDATNFRYKYTIDNGIIINVPFDKSENAAKDTTKAFALFKRFLNNKELC